MSTLAPRPLTRRVEQPMLMSIMSGPLSSINWAAHIWGREAMFELNKYFFEPQANWQLAKRVVYTKGRTVGEICDEIVMGLER